MRRQMYLKRVFAGLALALGAAVVVAAVRSASAQQPARPTANPVLTAEQVLQQTERFLRPAAGDELLALGQELRARGEEAAARRLFAALTTTEADYERMARQLLQWGQTSAVPDLLSSWARRFPRSARPKFYQAVAYHAAGEFELARRELRSLAGNVPADLQPLAELQSSLIELYLRGTPPGVDANPWSVRFVDASGGYTAGQIDPAQARRLPANAASASMALLLFMPRQGNLWYLAGEAANAEGNPQLALECLRRAEILQYAPKIVRDRRRVLEEFQRQARQDSEAALAAATPPASTSAAARAAEPPAGWTNLGANPKMLVILSVGGAFVLWVLVLQIREWRRPRRR